MSLRPIKRLVLFSICLSFAKLFFFFFLFNAAWTNFTWPRPISNSVLRKQNLYLSLPHVHTPSLTYLHTHARTHTLCMAFLATLPELRSSRLLLTHTGSLIRWRKSGFLWPREMERGRSGYHLCASNLLWMNQAHLLRSLRPAWN